MAVRVSMVMCSNAFKLQSLTVLVWWSLCDNQRTHLVTSSWYVATLTSQTQVFLLNVGGSIQCYMKDLQG